MKHFKIKIGYGENDFVPIDENELQTALYVFMTDSKGVFKNGVVRGKDIIGIMEDWHREMGWNYAHVMEKEDWEQIDQEGVRTKYAGIIGETKDYVKNLIETKQEHLIGKMPVPEKPKYLNNATKALADKFRIK